SVTHNLMLLLEENLRINEKMEDRVESKKKIIRDKTKKQGTGFRGNLPISYINNFFSRAMQRTLRFIRWLRDGQLKRLRYRDSLAELADVWKCPHP
ncbi:MAG: hypothetical protein ACI9NQ_000254, partial [Paracoccaceae bacterium]